MGFACSSRGVGGIPGARNGVLLPAKPIDTPDRMGKRPCVSARGPEVECAVRRVTLCGLIANLALSALKLTVGFLGSSQAVMADGVHSLSDITTDIAVLWGMRYWSAPPDQEHPYGHRRIETAITAFIGVILGTVAVGLAYNGLRAVREPDLAPPGRIALIGAAVSIIGKELLYRWSYTVGKRVRSSALRANAWHHRSDAMSSIPVAGAVLVAGVRPEWAFIDRIGAVVVSLFILYAAWRILRPALAELVDTGASAHVREEIEKLAGQHAAVCYVHAVRTRRHGAGLHVDLHIGVDGKMSVREGHDVSEEVKEWLLASGPDIVDVIVHLEPCSDT